MPIFTVTNPLLVYCPYPDGSKVKPLASFGFMPEISFDRAKERERFSFPFLIFDYGFNFSKVNLGNMTDDEGKLIFYGPLVCYSFSNENICINFMYYTK